MSYLVRCRTAKNAAVLENNYKLLIYSNYIPQYNPVGNKSTYKMQYVLPLLTARNGVIDPPNNTAHPASNHRPCHRQLAGPLGFQGWQYPRR
jgi:hypothetical protein